MKLAELIKSVKLNGIKEEDFDKVNIVVVNENNILSAINRISVVDKYGDITLYLFKEGD